MFEVNEETGDITLTQGDTGNYTVSGLPTDQRYTLYFGVQDENRNPVGSEISESLNLRSTVSLSITSALTDLLTVKKNEDFATYYFGLKLCTVGGMEDTLIIGNKEIGERNIMTVYPKQVEGMNNGSGT